MTSEEQTKAMGDDIVTPTLPYGVGIDTHKAFIQVCIYYQWEHATHRVEDEFQTTWTDLNRAARWIAATLTQHGLFKPGDLLRYTIESTGCYHIPVCQALGGTPSVINPVLAGPTRRKTDVLDARTLAHHSIVGLWRPSYVLPEQVEILRCLVAMRNESVRNASRVINRVNNHLLRFGHTIGREGSVASMQIRPMVEDMCRGIVPMHPAIKPEGIPDKSRRIFTDSYHQHDFFKNLSKEYHKEAIQWVNQNEWPTEKGTINGKLLLGILQSVPGVGELTALTWLSVVSDPRRFSHSKQVAAFCGSDPSVKVSAGKTTSHTKRKGNARLHHALKNCASQLVRRHDDPLGQWGFGILRRHRKGSWGRAINAVARRLAICLWHVHRVGFPFSYEQYRFYLAPDVPDVELEETNLHARYKKMLTDKGLTTTGEVARAFMTTLPQEKGIGVGCLTAVKEWMQENARPRSQPNPLLESPPPSPPPPATGGTGSTRPASSTSRERSPAEAAPNSRPTRSPAKPRKKSSTESPASAST